MTKVLNPLIVKLAGRRHCPMAAQIQHVGRRSGKAYVTPAAAHVHGDVIVIALTFGNQSDWARNVRASGSCTPPAPDGAAARGCRHRLRRIAARPPRAAEQPSDQSRKETP